MRLLLQPEHAGQAERHFDATRVALRFYGEWFGAYPYGHVTVVDPAWQSGAGGMEYPTLFTAGTRWLAPRHVMQPESVTVHEAGHQFWYGIVGMALAILATFFVPRLDGNYFRARQLVGPHVDEADLVRAPSSSTTACAGRSTSSPRATSTTR